MADLEKKKVSLLPDTKTIEWIAGVISLMSIAVLVIFFALLPVPLSLHQLLIIVVASIGFFALYFILPRIYFHETLLMVGDALYIILITYIASNLGEYGIFILFLYFVIIIADALKYPLSEYIIVVIFSMQAVFFYILFNTSFPVTIRFGILAIFAFSTLATAIFIWYFASQILNERSLRSLMERKTSYLKAMNDHLTAIDNMRKNIMQVTSHEFRTPLTRIKYSLDELRDSKVLELQPDQLQLLQIAAASNTQLIGMINDLMDASRLNTIKSKVKIQKLSVTSYIKELLDDYKDILAARNQKLVVNLPKEEIFAKIDPMLIKVAYKNMLDNASKYTAGGGTITVSMTKTDTELLLSVQDTGIGIAENEQTQLFSQFYRTDKAILAKPDGFGMGLYLSRQIVRLHKGDIKVTSEEGKGSTFTIHLPSKVLTN